MSDDVGRFRGNLVDFFAFLAQAWVWSSNDVHIVYYTTDYSKLGGSREMCAFSAWARTFSKSERFLDFKISCQEKPVEVRSWKQGMGEEILTDVSWF